MGREHRITRPLPLGTDPQAYSASVSLQELTLLSLVPGIYEEAPLFLLLFLCFCDLTHSPRGLFR